MKWYISAVVVILSSFYNEASSNPALLELKLALDYAKSIMGAVSGAKSMVDLIEGITGQTTSIEDVKKILLNKLENMEVNIPEDIQQAAQIDDDLREIFNEMGDINRLYKSYYLKYLGNEISNASLHDFITKATSIHADGPDRRVTKIFNIICPGELGVVKGSFLDKAVTQLNTREHHRCRKFKSPQQYIFELYILIGTIELRAYAMIISAFKMRSFVSNADNQLDIKRINEEHGDRMKKYITAIKEALSQAKTNVTRCKPGYQSSYANTMNNVQFVSLVWMMSDTNNNKVVTGIRFVVDGYMLHLQIEEGKLIAGGEIEAESNKWVPVEVHFNVKTQKVIWNKGNGKSSELKLNDGFGAAYMGNSYLHRADVKAKCTNCVLVGARIGIYVINNTRVYYLILKFAEADMKTGTILYDRYFEQAYDPKPEDDHNSRGKPELAEIGYKGDLSNVAFFDSNGLYTEPRLPLGGVGIYKNPDFDHGDAASIRIFVRDLAASIKTEL